jgi:hypothetical protein
LKTNYNLLKDAYSIKNVSTCRYDSLHGYVSDFSRNGDVDGWDIYSNICLYGVWDNILFGTSLDKECYISRTNIFIPIPAEEYHIFKVTMKLTIPDDLPEHFIPTKGRLMWQTVADPSWDEDKSVDFDLVVNDQWYSYIINTGESQYWQGDVSNVRIYPFTDGKPDIRFTIKTINIDSTDYFQCINTQCDYYTKYSHPCLGIGKRASITSGIPKEHFTTVSGVDDKLIINIDGYGDQQVNLGNFTNLDGNSVAKVLVNKISLLNVGQYAYMEAEFISDQNKLILYSGSYTEGGSIEVGGPAAKVLGFFDEFGTDVSYKTVGEAPASGFDYSASRRLKGFELNGLIDLDTNHSAYSHNPNQYTVEAGRSDFVDSMSSTHAPRPIDVDYYEELDGNNKLIIDGSHPVNDSGRITLIKVNGSRCKDVDVDMYSSSRFSSSFSKVVLLRPYKPDNVETSIAQIIYTATIEDPEKGTVHTADDVTYSVEVDWLVNKGDLIGFYNFNVLCPFSMYQRQPNAVYFEVLGLPDGKFSIGKPAAKGVIGLSFYARSSRLQENIQLDIDLGRRVNIEELYVYGEELKTDYEYNVAACLDVNWEVDLHNETHWHSVSHCYSSIQHREVEHRNKAYGIECLCDCITTPDNGQQGTSYTTNPLGGGLHYDGTKYIQNDDPDTYSGLVTIGNHCYFYVNGDGEWNNAGCSYSSDENAAVNYMEFQYPWNGGEPYDYEFDPITFTLLFPYGKKIDVHKSAIYFKESNNFKHLSLSYYLGEFGENGDAEEIHWKYVPTFTSIDIDGTMLYEGITDGERRSQQYDEIYFSNPWPWAKPEYKDGQCTNWDIYQTVMNERLNTLTHYFEPVGCYGFRYHNEWHLSTKITEIEVFSYLLIEPSLLDNVSVYSSVYSDEWYELVFTEDVVDSGRIKAHVAGSPRYLKLEIKSQDIFKFKELNAFVSNEYIKNLDCYNTIAADNAPKGVVTESKELTIENTYNVPLNLIVDIPADLFKQEDILSWIRFDSEESTINAEIGTGAVVRKNPDYPLFMEKGQVANNCNSYYLKNMVDGAASYQLLNNYKWCYYKTLYHNEDVGFTNSVAGKAYSATFDKVSSKYWKLGVFDTGRYELSSFKLYNGLDLVDNYNIYIQAISDLYSGKFKTSIDPVTGSILPVGLVEDDFSNNTYLDYWDYSFGTNPGNNNFIEKHGAILPYLDAWGFASISKEFFPGVLSFSIDINFRFDLPNNLKYIIELIDEDNRVLFTMSLTGQLDTTAVLDVWMDFPIDQEMTYAAVYGTNPMIYAAEYNITNINLEELTFSVKKVGNTFDFVSLINSKGESLFSVSDKTAFPDRVTKLRISYKNISSENYYTQTNKISTSNVNFKALPYLSAQEYIAFDFNSSEPVDRFEFVHTQDELLKPAVLISNLDNNDYVFWARNFSITGSLTSYNFKTYSDNAYTIFSTLSVNSKPWNLFTDDGDKKFYFSDCNSCYVKYDFGAGNSKIINYIYYVPYTSTNYQTPDTLQLYGTNQYGSSFDPNSSDNTLLVEFEINKYGEPNAYNEEYFVNNNYYRFLIIYWPPRENKNQTLLLSQKIILGYKFDSSPTSSLMITENNYYNYIAIDLGQRHDIDFLRNSGPNEDLYNIWNNADIVFSGSDTDNIEEVEWIATLPALLLNFEDFTDSSEYSHILLKTGDVTISTVDSPVVPNGHAIFNGGSISIDSSSAFNLYSNEFTIDFRVLRISNGYGGIISKVSDLNSTSSFSFTFDIDGYLVVTLHSGGNLFELKSQNVLNTYNWYHVAVVRFNGTLGLYIDGEVQDSIYIGVGVEINSSVTPLILGNIRGFYFNGYLDEVRFLNGLAYWEHSFNPPEVAYSSAIVGDKTNARWVKIPLLCGDNIVRYLQYIGIYPNITKAYMPGGGFNCEWIPFTPSNRLTDYSEGARNIAPYCTILNIAQMVYDFDESGLAGWGNLNYSSVLSSGIEQTNFSGEFVDSIWESYTENFTNIYSNIVQENKALTINFNTDDDGDCSFRTKEVSGSCSMEIEVSFNINSKKTGSTFTSLSIYNQDRSSYSQIIRLNRSDQDSPRLHFVKDDTLVTFIAFSGTSIEDITKFKIEKQGYTFTISYFNRVSNTWLSFNSFDDYTFTYYEPVFFEFLVDKQSDFPEEIINITNAKLVLEDKLVQSDSVWGISPVEGGSSLYCLEYLTPEVLTDLGPILIIDDLSDGRDIQNFEFYYYNEGVGGGGFSILDNNDDEILGIATNSPEWMVHSINGWEVIKDSVVLGNDGWYKVVVSFDWSLFIADITWQSAYTNDDYINCSVGLIKQTNVSKFQIRAMAGRSWGLNYQKIKFDNITITPNTYWMYEWSPYNCLSGDSTVEGYDSSWGFSTVDPKPTLILDLGGTYTIDKFKLVHNPSSETTDWLNTAYTISYSTSMSGIFTPIVQVADNTDYSVTHYIADTITCAFVKLEIDAYTKPTIAPILSVEGQDVSDSYIIIDGGFLREFEIWTYENNEPINSQDHPVVCLDLGYLFNISGHDFKLYGDYPYADNWSNDEDFYQYSDDCSPNPNEVSFGPTNGANIPFYYYDEYIDVNYIGGPVILTSSVFLSKGDYKVRWEIYAPDTDGLVNMDIIGYKKYTLSSSVIASDWIFQTNSMNITESGYYSIQVRALPSSLTGPWGIRAVSFENTQTTSKWVAFRRITAENFTYDERDPKAILEEDRGVAVGIDYLEKIFIYTNEYIRPTECSWWWSSGMSVLGNDDFNTKEGFRSLKISYPDSNRTDFIRFQEGDTFGLDDKFSFKDSLTMWLYISDIEKLDIGFGGIAFGSFDGWNSEETLNNYLDKYYDLIDITQNIHYWDFKDMDLITGWNLVRLRFDHYTNIYPEADPNTGFLDSILNYRKHRTSSFGMMFKGKGEAFHMFLDAIKIERNYFYDDVIFGDKGLCLTWGEFAEIPLSCANLRRGSIEMWLKLYTGSDGKDIYEGVASRTIFTLVNNRDECITLSIRGSHWFEIGIGNTKASFYQLYVDSTEYDLSNYTFGIGDIFHIALVWSNDGVDMSNNNTLRLYINGTECLSSNSTWDVTDDKGSLLRLGGGNSYLSTNDNDDGSAIFSNVKLYNYCKEDYDLNERSPKIYETSSPNSFLYLSKDDVNFYSNTSVELPMVFEALQPGENVKVYTKVDKTNPELYNKHTGTITVDWEVPV